MNILYILPSLANTAPIAIAYYLVEACIKEKFNVEVAFFDNINGLTFPCHTYQITMRTIIDFDKYDIIHSHMRRPDKYVAKHRGKITKAKTISTIHCDIYEDLKYSYGKIVAYVYSKLWTYNLKKIDYIVQVSEFLMKKYNKLFDNNVLIHNGVKICNYEMENYSDIMNKIKEYHSKNYKIIISYSNINRRKGLNQILNVIKEREDLSYICIGNGEELDNIKRIVIKAELQNRVCFFPFILAPYNIIPYIDIVAVPSYSESFCLAIHEAGMLGASVVCSDIPAFRDAFDESEVSFFELDNSESLLRAISNALKCSYGMNLQRKELACYTLDKMQDSYLKLYRGILKNRVYE